MENLKLKDDADENRIFARGASVQVCYDYGRGQSVPVPDGLRKALAGYLS